MRWDQVSTKRQDKPLTFEQKLILSILSPVRSAPHPPELPLINISKDINLKNVTPSL